MRIMIIIMIIQMDEVTYTTTQRKLYKTNKCHLIIAIIGAEDEKIDHPKKNISILISEMAAEKS